MEMPAYGSVNSVSSPQMQPERETFPPGIIVHGDNHFIVRGPRPEPETVRALVNHWSIIRIGAATPERLRRWRISTREFRENLAWAFVVPGDQPHTPAVQQLLVELQDRGIPI